MELSKRERTIKYCVYAVIIAICALLQNVSGLFLQIGEARCFLLVPVAVLLSLDEDEKSAALLGLFAGLLWDCVSAHHMGFNSIYIMLASYVSALLVNRLFRATYWVGYVGAVIFTLLYCVLYWVLFVAFKGGDGAVSSLIGFYLPSFVYTCVVALPLNLLIVPLRKRLNKS